jgi:acetoin utilization deacetylase AcuC-like enzyme
MRASCHRDYYVGLPTGHPFPMAKYPRLRDLLLARGLIAVADLIEPVPLDLALARRVHTEEYLRKLEHGTLSASEQRKIGVPWSGALWRRSRLAAQGTLLAAECALVDGIGANLAGGTHHAFADHGEGFCVLNDVAIAIRSLQARSRIARALVVDLDVHQGNGTAAIFAGDDSVVTFSMHGTRNYPAIRQRSTLDVELADGTDDAAYLGKLQEHLPAMIRAARADLAFYLAGVDVAAGDRYGRFTLTDEGIRARDHYVLRSLAAAGVPTAITLAGGYAPTAERTAELHAIVFDAAFELRSEHS